MEILAHTLWTTAGVIKVNAIAKKKGQPFQMSTLWTAFWGIFPDLFAFTLPFVFSFYKVISGQQQFGSFSTRHQIADGFTLSHTLYQYSHSLIVFIIVFLVIWFLIKKPPWVLLGWALHILIDIPSHALAFFPTPFLFPISEYRFPFGVAWSNTWFMIINYSTLLIVWGSILFKKYHKSTKTAQIIDKHT
ncbi:MAG: hypothetical protein WC603_03755 [Candidatus Paceibacterota bacterium]|jgi:hypothetical protein